MELSKRFQLVLSDVLNTFKHVFYGVVVTCATATIEYLQNGQQIDWETLKVGAIISVLHGVIVLADRYLADNTAGTVGSGKK